MEFSKSIEPCDDECLEGSESMCSCVGQSNGHGVSCFIGVMGWLLACRQAYIDGIRILYSTNTFHISSLELQLNLPRLLVPHHLEHVTSLELLWKLNAIHKGKAPVKDHVKLLWDSSPSHQGPSDSPLHIMCAMIPATFPNVRSLYISFQCWLDPGLPKGGPGGDVISEVETIFLGPVEEMMRVYLRAPRRRPGQNLALNVAIQRGAWWVLLEKYHKLLGPKLKLESVDELSRGRFWKPLGSGTGSCVEAENDEDEDFGYWVCGGWEDMRVFGHDYWIMTHWGDKWTGTKMTY